MSIKAILFDLDGTLLPMDQNLFVKAYFGLLAKKLSTRGYEAEKLIDAMQKGDATATVLALFNRFEEVIMPQRPAVLQIKEMLMEHGALAAQMSGSGPAVFGIFADEAAAGHAADRLKSIGVRAYACKTLA